MRSENHMNNTRHTSNANNGVRNQRKGVSSAGSSGSRKQRLRANRRKYHLLLLLLVVLTVVFLDGMSLFLKDRVASDTENRNLQQVPQLTWSRLVSGKFESEFETYIADQFPFRDGWIALESTISRMMGKTESNNIYLAKDGYLIQRFNEPSEEQCTALADSMAQIAAINPKITTRVMVIPTAVSTYKALLPKGAPAGNQDAFIDKMQTETTARNLTWIDAASALKNADPAMQLYYRTDHHWTTDAAYLAFGAYAEAAGLKTADMYDMVMISDTFSGTLTASSGLRVKETDEIYMYLPKTPLNIAVNYVNENKQTATMYVSEQLKERDHYTVFFGGNHPLVSIECDPDIVKANRGEESSQGTADNGQENMNGGQNVLMVFKDSYANCFVPFLVPYYNKVIMVDPRYYNDNLQELIASEGVTEMLFLYNASTLAEDHNIRQMLQ